jgi:NADH dehydrogenase
LNLMQVSKVCILGGSGFVGRSICAELARRGVAVRVMARRRERARHLLVFPQLELVEGSCHFAPDLAGAFTGCDAVINLVGILHPSGEATFERVHAELPALVARVCRERGVPRLLHMSSLGAARDAPSEYLRTKGHGEEAAHAGAGVSTTSFRPSVIFGPGDGLFNRFAGLLRIVPFVVPLAKAGARLQPVYVADVAAAMCVALDDRKTFGKRYDLGGPEVMTLEGVVRYTAEVLGLRRIILPLGDRLATLQARVLERLPGKLLTEDNLRSLGVDSVTARNGFEDFGIPPARVESIVPGYLGEHTRRGRNQRFRSAARRD